MAKQFKARDKRILIVNLFLLFLLMTSILSANIMDQAISLHQLRQNVDQLSSIQIKKTSDLNKIKLRAEVEQVYANYEQAKKYFYVLLKASYQLNKKSFVMSSLWGLATINAICGDYLEALFYLDLIIAQGQYNEMTYKAVTYKAIVLEIMGKEKEALSLYRSMIHFFDYSSSALLGVKKDFDFFFAHRQIRFYGGLEEKDFVTKKVIKKEKWGLQCGAFSLRSNAEKVKNN